MRSRGYISLAPYGTGSYDRSINSPSVISDNKGGFKSTPLNRYPTIFMDATLVEEHKAESQVTNLPTITGFIRQDSVVRLPLLVKITGLISEGYVYSKTRQNAQSQVPRPIVFFDLLNQLRDNVVLMRITTGLKIYKRMLLIKIETVESKDTLISAIYDLTFQEIRVTNTHVKYSNAPKEDTNIAQSNNENNIGATTGYTIEKKSLPFTYGGEFFIYYEKDKKAK